MIFYHDKLYSFRIKSGISIKHISERLGIVRSTYWTWEKGKRVPNEEYARKLAEVLKIEVDEISSLKSIVQKSVLSETSTVWMNFENSRGEEILKNQEKAMSSIRQNNLELFKAWTVIHAIIKSLDVILYVKDEKQNYIMVNDNFKKNLSLNPLYVAFGKNDNDFFSSKTARSNIKEDEKVLETGETVSYREGYILGSRNKKWGLISKYPIKDSFGKVSGIIGIIEDNTEKKKLEFTRYLLEHAINNTNDVFMVWDINTYEMIFLSNGIEDLTGYSRECFLVKNAHDFWLTIVHSDDFEEEKKIIESKDFPPIRLIKITKKDGSFVWIRLSVSFFEYEGKNYQCTTAIDVTQKQQVNDENMKLNEIINSLDDLFVFEGEVSTNNELKLTYTSKNVSNITGYPKELFYNQSITFYSIVHPQHKYLFEEWNKNKYQKYKKEHKIICSDGNEKWVNTTIIPVEGIKKRKIIIGFCTDITEKKEYDILNKNIMGKKIKEERASTLLEIANKMEKNGESIDNIFKYTNVRK